MEMKHEVIITSLDNLENSITRIERIAIYLEKGSTPEKENNDDMKRNKTSLLEFLDKTPTRITELNNRVIDVVNYLTNTIQVDKNLKNKDNLIAVSQ